MTNSAKKALINLGIITVSISIVLLVSESAVRLIVPQATMFPRFVVSREFKIELPPNVRIHHSRGELWSFIYTTNELGRRGPFLPFAGEYDTENVVALGDSFTFGVGVADGEEYASVLQAALGEGFAVVNGGMGGWGIDSQTKWFDQFGRRYVPRTVVLQFCANDPFDSDTGVVSVEDGELRFHPYLGEKPAWQRLVSSSALLQRSHLYSLVRAIIAAPAAPPVDTVVGVNEARERRRRRVQERYVEILRAF